MSRVLLQFAFVPLTIKIPKNNFIGKTRHLQFSLLQKRWNKAKASSLHTTNMKYLPRK